MTSYSPTQRFSEYTPELITDVNGMEADSIVTRIGDKTGREYVVVGFDLAWDSEDFHIVMIVRKVGFTRRAKIHAHELDRWVRV